MKDMWQWYSQHQARYMNNISTGKIGVNNIEIYQYLSTNLSVVSHEYGCSLSGYISLFVVSGPWCRHSEAVFQGQDELKGTRLSPQV